MVKLRIRVNQSSTIEEIAEVFENILNCGQKEVELNHLIKIVEALGGEYVTEKKVVKDQKKSLDMKFCIMILSIVMVHLVLIEYMAVKKILKYEWKMLKDGSRLV